MRFSDEAVHSLPDAILTLEESGNVTGWHGAAQSLLGWSAEEALGRNVNSLLRPRLPGGEPAILPRPGSRNGAEGPASASGATSQGPAEEELLVKAKDDSDVWVGVAYGFCKQKAGAEQYVAALRDIRHRKGVDIAKSDVISSVAHELRSPLTSIKGFASTLVRRWDRFDDERRRQILMTIEADADRVTRLIAELLDLSRLEEGRLQLRRQPVQLGLIAERVVHQLDERSADHSLELSFPHPFPTVMADPDKVEQVLTNLVENALKYTEGGKIRIEGVVDPSAVRVSVSDEGPGIPTDHRHNVFRKFFRRADLASSASPVQPGSGLGLYISKGLVEAHGGSIWVDDAPGGGASIAFTLPLN